MSTEISALTTLELQKLTDLESKIDSGITTFLDVGAALSEIRDNKLYRSTHMTFDQYLRDRWGFSRGYGYYLIQATEVQENIFGGEKHNLGEQAPDLPPIPTERHARALAKAPPNKQKEAWAKANATSEKPSVRETNRAVAQVVEAQNVRNVDPGEQFANTLRAAHGEGRALIKSINEAMSHLESLQSTPGLEVLVNKNQQIRSFLQSAKNCISSSLPAGVCPKCKGNPKGCPTCGNLGWINAITKQQLQ
jgi:hypothetical protein